MESRAGQRVTVTKVALEPTIEGSIFSHSYSTNFTVLREAIKILSPNKYSDLAKFYVIFSEYDKFNHTFFLLLN